MNIGQDNKALVNQSLGRLKRARNVGEEGLVIANDFQLDHIADPGLAGQAAGPYRVRGVIAAGGVGQDGVVLGVDIVEQILLVGVGDIHPTDRHRHNLGSRGLNRLFGFRKILILSRANDKPGMVFLACEYKGVFGAWHGVLTVLICARSD